MCRCVDVSKFFSRENIAEIPEFRKRICLKIDTSAQTSIYLLEPLAEGAALAIAVWLAWIERDK